MTKEIYTIGYSGRTPEQLKAIADELGASLVDIRFSPRSRNPQWAKSNLQKVFGQKYRHLPQWGNENYKGGDIKIADFEGGRLEIDKMAAPVILLCACKDHTWCHRTFIRDILVCDLGQYNVVELSEYI